MIYLLIYFLSVAYVYNCFRIAYSKNGRWSNLETTIIDICLTFIPIINSIVVIAFLIQPPMRNNNSYNKFFRVVRESDFTTYGVEVITYPIFRKDKCQYDSYTKIGYHYQLLQTNEGSKLCYHLDSRFLEIFPKNLLDMEAEDANDFEKIGYKIYRTKGEAEEAALKELISKYPQTAS